MKPRSIYLASPIDQASRWDAPGGMLVSWVDMVANLKDTLMQRWPGYIFDPSAMFQGAAPNATMFNILDNALETCDLVVAVLPAGVPTLGTPTEIEQAMLMGKPILLVTDLEGVSWVVEKWKARYDLLVVASMTGVGIKLSDALQWVDLLPDAYSSEEEVVADYAETVADYSEAIRTFQTVDEVQCWAVEDDYLKWMRLDGSAHAPRRAYPDDAGFDLSVITGCSIAPRHTVNMPCGIAVQLPPWAWGMITGRSSIWQKGLHVPVSVIDAGWRGEIFVAAHNLTDRVVELKAGDRVGQLIILENSSRRLVDVMEVEDLDPHDRGVQGFGSTGR